MELKFHCDRDLTEEEVYSVLKGKLPQSKKAVRGPISFTLGRWLGTVEVDLKSNSSGTGVNISISFDDIDPRPEWKKNIGILFLAVVGGALFPEVFLGPVCAGTILLIIAPEYWRDRAVKKKLSNMGELFA